MRPLKQGVAPLAEDQAAALAIDQLFRSHGPWLRGALRRRFGASVREIAEDLVQETYLRLSPGHVAGAIRRPRAFLMRIASNLALDHLRRRKVYQRARRRGGLPQSGAAEPHQSAEPLAV